MKWTVPNQLTVGRVGLSIVFFVLLALYQPGAGAARWLLNGAFVIFVVAGITDFLLDDIADFVMDLFTHPIPSELLSQIRTP